MKQEDVVGPSTVIPIESNSEEDEEDEKVPVISTGRPPLNARVLDSPAHWQQVKKKSSPFPLQLNTAYCL